MGEAPSMYSNLSNQTQFRLNKINKVKDYFMAEICERVAMSKRLTKYIATFDYFDKVLLVLSATIGGVSIVFFASVIGVPVRIASTNFSFAFSTTTEIKRKLLKITRNKAKEA